MLTIVNFRFKKKMTGKKLDELRTAGGFNLTIDRLSGLDRVQED